MRERNESTCAGEVVAGQGSEWLAAIPGTPVAAHMLTAIQSVRTLSPAKIWSSDVQHAPVIAAAYTG